MSAEACTDDAGECISIEISLELMFDSLVLKYSLGFRSIEEKPVFPHSQGSVRE
jgi:hypothetical protein